MGIPRPPRPVKLFIGFITRESSLAETMKSILIKRFGPVDFQSDVFDFNSTDYYSDEMGRDLKRLFISFGRLVRLENICSIKILTNRLETKFSRQKRRMINLDPGYISLSKVALFTTKDFYHRLYLGRNIYAEATLYYKERSFRPFEWTYPDYRSKGYIDFFNAAREGYSLQLRKL